MKFASAKQVTIASDKLDSRDDVLHYNHRRHTWIANKRPKNTFKVISGEISFPLEVRSVGTSCLLNSIRDKSVNR